MTTLFEKNAGFPNTLFHYLNTHHDAEGIRQRLEAWFARFPAAGPERRDFINKFRAKDNRQYHGAFFELYCHELLLRQGFDVQTHPQTSSRKNSSPDFLVSKDQHPLFYFECTICTYSNQADGIRTNEQEIVDYVNRNVHSPDYELRLKFIEQTLRTPNKRKLRAIEHWLERHDAATVRHLWETQQRDQLPVFDWHDVPSGWRAEITVWPAMSRDNDIIAAISHLPTTLDVKGPVKENLIMKAKHYGNLKLPLVIAINNVTDFLPDEVETAELLLGSRRDNAAPLAERKKDGFWKPGSRRHQDIAAVLVANRIRSIDFVHKDDVCLWHQPPSGDDAARHEIEAHWQGPQFIPISDGDAWSVRRQPGTSVLDLLNLR
ncbi:MAG: hypothetical protein L0154_29195 [Chloroflexi bacterium]|nr:hypothetical protein [Chloroflexota bacterium]